MTGLTLVPVSGPGRLMRLSDWQPDLGNANDRLWLLEKIVAAWLLVVLLVDPSLSRLSELLDLYTPSWYRSSPVIVDVLRGACVIAAACILLGVARAVMGWGLALGFLFISGLSSSMGGAVWNYNLHLFWFLIMCRLGSAAPAMALALMQVSVALFYLQSGLSKLLASGPHWFLSGDTLIHYGPYLGTTIGRTLSEHPLWCAAITMATGIIEFILPVALMLRFTQRWAVPIAWSFHLGVALVFGIGYWQLTLLYIALFFQLPAVTLRRWVGFSDEI
jgi:hypothetical protein